MKKKYLILVISIFIFCCYNVAYCQVTGTHIFLQGSWLELGVANNGSLGAGPSPAGYHSAPLSGSAHPTAGGNLAHVYDYLHNGWGTGAPVYFGDFTYPGTPFEGWSMQVNGTRCDAFYTTDPAWTGVGFTGSLTGSNTTYTNAGGIISGVWQGTAGGLNVTQTTRIDQNASWAVMTVQFTNPTGAAIPGVYYWRTCDPDDDVVTSGFYETNNYIVYQNDVDHRVEVSSTGNHNTNTYLALCTKDCRAKAMIYQLWSPYPSTSSGGTLDQVYNQTAGFLGTTYYGLGQSTINQDIAIGLIYNIGTIPAGGRAIISYAYTYGATNATTLAAMNNAIDSAFPEPTLVVNGIPGPPSGPAPAPTYDTFRACGSGLTTLPVNINFASDKNWTWSTWTWSPGTGLATTTGVTNTITLTALPPIITYTITGTDSAVNMLSCGNRVLYLTILTCNGAVANSPCQGDTLKFNAPGDSTGATYSWYGPAPSTTVVGTTQSFFIYPAVMTDTGTYYVIKTVGAVHDTAWVHVVIYPLPTVPPPTSLCPLATETLTATPIGGTWSSSNPPVASIDPNTGVVTAGSVLGTTTMTYTSPAGCKSTTTVTVITLSPITGNTSLCQWTTTTLGNSAPGGTWTSVNTAVATIGYTSGVVTGVTAGTSVITYMIGGGCLATTTVTVFSGVVANAVSSAVLGCNGNMVTFTNSTNPPAPATTYVWNFGDGGTSTATDPVHNYATIPGQYTATLIATTTDGCVDGQTFPIDTRHTVKAVFTSSLDTMCLNPSQSTTLTDASTATVGTGPGQINNYAWNYGDGNTSVATGPPNPDPAFSYTYTAEGYYQIALVVTDAIGCKDSTTHNVVVVRVDITSFHDTTLCLRQPLQLKNEITWSPNNLPGPFYWTYLWSESPFPNLDNPNVKEPFLSGYGTFTDILTATVNGPTWGGCFATDVIVVHSVLGQLLTNVSPDQVIPYGSTIQLNADNELYYHWIPNDGSIDNPNINNPVAAPVITTHYTVYGMDKYGCVDSAFVTITVDSTMNEGIPTAFTPNGDGLNDVFRPVGIKYQRLIEFRIFNRWGQQVFYSNNIKDAWDGTCNGVPQDVGVYNYIAIVARPGSENHEGQNIVYKGNVTLLR